MPMTKQKAERIATIIDAHFPDAVDIHMVPILPAEVDMNVIECMATQKEIEEFCESNPGQELPFPQSKIKLVEIEPETGIFAAMSPVTHDVYVYLADEAIA